MRGQIDFDGYEIQADTIDVPGLGTIPLAKVRPDLDVHIGDAFTIELTMRIAKPTFGTGGADDAGNLKGEFDRHFRSFPDKREGRWEVTGYITRAEREAEERRQQGAAS